MNVQDAIKLCIDTGRMVSTGYVEDLSDEELLHRPHPDCNHIKWQLGHLIASENHIINAVVPGAMPPLLDGFAAKYTKETAKLDDPSAFHSKAELLQAFEQQRAGTLAALAKLSPSDLDRPGPEAMRSYCPTVAAAFDLQGSHWLMHAGQWAVIRRQLGRPPLF